MLIDTLVTVIQLIKATHARLEKVVANKRETQNLLTALGNLLTLLEQVQTDPRQASLYAPHHARCATIAGDCEALRVALDADESGGLGSWLLAAAHAERHESRLSQLLLSIDQTRTHLTQALTVEIRDTVTAQTETLDTVHALVADLRASQQASECYATLDMLRLLPAFESAGGAAGAGMAAPDLLTFLAKGVRAWSRSEGRDAPKCFISYAWEKGDANVVLQSWLKKLHTHLVTAGLPTQLDIRDMKETVSDYMQRGIAEADIVLVICTPQLSRRAGEGAAGQMTPDALDALSAADLDTHGFNNLQKELWHVRQHNRQGHARVFLLRREGDFTATDGKLAIPAPFFDAKALLVADFTEAKYPFEKALIETESPLGLVPSLFNLNSSEPASLSYQAMLAGYHTPSAGAEQAINAILDRLRDASVKQAGAQNVEQELSF